MGTRNQAVKEGAMQFLKSLALLLLNAGLLVFVFFPQHWLRKLVAQPAGK